MTPMRLQAANGWLLISDLDWQALCLLAEYHGWQEEDDEEKGRPHFLSRRCAAALADALAEALLSIPERDQLTPEEVEIARLQPLPWRQADVHRWFSGTAGRDLLGRVIRLARQSPLSLKPLD